jgi:catechol 2,3-dioxygenase-like lactoylglutathione lyase family enzyme
VRIEHLGLNVPNPVAAAAWYTAHLGFSVKRKLDQAPWTHFLADASGKVMIEIYKNPQADVPNYREMNPLVLHLAFTVDDVAAMRTRLLSAGASAVDEITVTPAGDQLAMLRDPWGMPIQLVKRAKPMV